MEGENMDRRTFLKGAVTAGALTMSSVLGIAQADWERKETRELYERLKALDARRDELRKVLDAQIKQFEELRSISPQEHAHILGDIVGQLDDIAKEYKTITEILINRLDNEKK